VIRSVIIRFENVLRLPTNAISRNMHRVLEGPSKRHSWRKRHVRDEDTCSVTRHVHDETGPHRGLGLLKVDFPAVETGGCGDDDACPAECETHVRMEVYLFEQVQTRQVLH
jgi:hypothetical protein